MDDEFEDKVFYQAFISHMKLLSKLKFAVGVPSLNSTTLSYIWKLIRFYIIKPEVLICGVVLFVFLIYLQAVELWSRGLLSRIQLSLGYSRSRSSKVQQMLTTASPAEKQSWEITKDVVAAYAVQGRRPRMEDRFVVDDNINESGISLFGIFDGHGGEFAADFAKDYLIQNLHKKIIETSDIVRGRVIIDEGSATSSRSTPHCKSPTVDNKENILKSVTGGESQSAAQRRSSFRKSYSTDDNNCDSKGNCDKNNDDIYKLNSILRPLTKEAFINQANQSKEEKPRPEQFEAKCYIENGKINFGKMLTDEVLVADYNLVEAAKKTTNVAGTTALIAIMEGTQLFVANVGDSRGVMCDSKGNAIPLSFDHKPQQVRERKRIHDAGGFISFKGVWRVAGILATSRALGDYPLKDKNLVIANPDILTFDLKYHKPMFLILASDGLWDTFTNEEAVTFIRERLDEDHFGAKSITLQSFNRGSVDNITVLVIVFKDGVYQIGSSDAAT